MTVSADFSDLIPADHAVPPGGWEPLATFADDHGDGRIHVTLEGWVRLHGVLLVDVPGFHPAPAAPGITRAPEGEIGWLGQSGGLVTLGAGLVEGNMSTHIARMLDVIEAPVRVCRGGILQIEGLSEGIAEQVVRVLAPLGLIFDAESPLLPGRN